LNIFIYQSIQLRPQIIGKLAGGIKYFIVYLLLKTVFNRMKSFQYSRANKQRFRFILSTALSW